MSWVIEARNNEIIPAYERNLTENPIRYSWNQEWHVVDRIAYKSRDAGALVTRNFDFWDAMEPATLEDCTEAMVDLAQKTQEYLKGLNVEADNYKLIQWRLRDIVSGETIPGELLAV